MKLRRRRGSRGPIAIQPGSSVKASARASAAPLCRAGVSGSALACSGNGRCRVRLSPLRPEDAMAARQALELQVATIVEVRAAPVAVAARSSVTHLLGDQDLATQRLRGDPGREDHVLPEVIPLLGD